MFLFFLLLAALVAAFTLYKNRKTLSEHATADAWLEQSLFWKCLIVPVIILVFGIVNPFRVERVDAGHVGIKVNLTGDKRGVSNYEYKTGWVIYNSWFSKLYEFPTYQQHIDYDPQIVITKGGFSATIKPSFNYSLKPGDVGDMFQNLRIGIKDVERQWLQTAIVGTVNDVANRWPVDSIFNHREEFESAIVVEANKRTQRWFLISQLRTNIVPPPSLQNSIEEKTKAFQQVQVAENLKLVAIAEMQRKIAVAKGDSSQRVINASAEAESNRVTASGEADAIKLKMINLSPQYIEYLKVTKWDGAMPQVQGAGSGILLNLKNQ